MRFFAAAGLVMILSGIAAFYALDRLSAFSAINLLAGPALLVVTAVVEARRFRGFTGSLSRRLALRWLGICAAVLALVIAANVLAGLWPGKLDLTVGRLYTLSDQTRTLCDRLAEELGGERLDLLLLEDALIAKDVRLLVDAYDADCPVNSREIGSAEAPPQAAAILEAYDTTVVACHGPRCEYVGYPSEGNITNALLRLVRSSEVRVSFSVGHGEGDLGSERDHGFSALTAALRDEGITLGAWVGPAQQEVPPDAGVLVFAAPARNLLQAELDALDRFLAGGGRLLVLLEPGEESNLTGLLERWGFALPPAIVVDRQTSPLLDAPRPVSLIVNQFGSRHPVTAKMSERTMVLMPSARPVLPARKPRPQDQLEGLLFSSPRAWAESDVAAALADRAIRPDPGETAGREIPLAAAGRYPRGKGAEARIVVIGDRDFASNRWLGALYNRDLVMNALLWLAEEEEQVAIRPKAWTPDTHPLPLETTLGYFYSLAFALPEILLLLGIHAWYRQQGS